MPKAGAVGGIAPAPPVSNTLAAPQEGGAGAETAAQPPEAKAQDGKPAAPPLPETSGRAPLPAAVALAATLAGLRVGQEVRGTVRLLPGQPQALLKTPQGDFLISPAAGLEADSELALVLTRADRSLAALLLTAGQETLDPPRTVALTLVSLRGGTPPAPQPVADQGVPPATPATPAPARPATVPASPLPSPVPAEASAGLTSLLPGETVALRGGGSVTLPQNSSTAPGDARASAPAPAGAPEALPPAMASAASPRPLLHGLVLPQENTPPAPAPAARGEAPMAGRPPIQASGADPVAALFARGALPLSLETGTGPAKRLAASLLSSAGAGETSPLTHPPARSPLARLAEAGRLLTATVLPPEGDVPAPAPQPPSRAAASSPVPTPAPAAPPPATATAAVTGGAQRAAPAQGAVISPGPDAPEAAPPAARVSDNHREALPPRPPQEPLPIRLNAQGAALRLDLPAGTRPPAPGTQLVFLVTQGHEALKAARLPEPHSGAAPARPPAAAAAAMPATTPATAATPPTDTPAPSAQPSPQPSVKLPESVTAEPPRHGQPAPAGFAPASSPTPAPTAPAAPTPPAHVATGESRGAEGKATTAFEKTAPAPGPTPGPIIAQAPARAEKGAAPSAPAAPADSGTGEAAPARAAPSSPEALVWIPGLSAPVGLTPAAPALIAANPGEALLMAVMQALGRKGFSARPDEGAKAGGKTSGDGSQAATPLARVAPLPTGEARAAMTPETARTSGLGAALPSAPPPGAPDAAPFALMLQTPQGPVPLLFLAWLPVRAEEDGKGKAASEGGAGDVCFAVEVRFEQMGLMRLRGAVNPKNLHLAVETEQPLEAALRHGVSRDFQQAIEAGGMAGALTFRHRQNG